MGAWAMIDFDAGRVAQGLGDVGVACLFISLEAKFPLMRALVKAEGDKKRSTEELLHEAQRRRAERPWPHRMGAWGWALLTASLILRWSGVS